MILARGPATAIREIADRLRQHKGVLHGALSMSSTGERLS
jgi:metal-responsive CopG/Arc/MetJ family transcriptional regulator